MLIKLVEVVVMAKIIKGPFDKVRKEMAFDNRVENVGVARDEMIRIFRPNNIRGHLCDVGDAIKVAETVIWKASSLPNKSVNKPGDHSDIYKRSTSSLFAVMNKDGIYGEVGGDLDRNKEKFIEFALSCKQICENRNVDFSDVQNGALPSYFNNDQGPKGDLIPE